ncbi:MAG: response regulator, partial [Chloroflexota bacterium]
MKGTKFTMTMTILYIEDNPLNMRLVRKLIQSYGYNMIEAMDGITGLDMIRTQQPDLVLVDVILLGGAGYFQTIHTWQVDI